MNGMEGMRLTQKTEYAFFWEIFGGKSYAAARANCGWLSVEKNWNGKSDPDLKHVGAVLFEIEIPCILLFLNRNKNSQNSPKRMQPKYKQLKISNYRFDLFYYSIMLIVPLFYCYRTQQTQ